MHLEAYLEVLPEWIRSAFLRVGEKAPEEIRLRVTQMPGVICGNREIVLPCMQRRVSREDLATVLRSAAKGSLYASAESMKNGYLTLPGGHRIGICGSAVMRNDAIRTVTDVSSLCIRIASERKGCGMLLRGSTLITGPPGSGKTTFLRDCIRMISDVKKERVGLADERGELAACLDGVPQLDIGTRTDVLSNFPKAEAVMMLLRTMNPQWIALDEITGEADALAIEQSAYCGAKIVATAHVWDQADLMRRKVYRSLMEGGVFDEVVILRSDHSREILSFGDAYD